MRRDVPVQKLVVAAAEEVVPDLKEQRVLEGLQTMRAYKAVVVVFVLGRGNVRPQHSLGTDAALASLLQNARCLVKTVRHARV